MPVRVRLQIDGVNGDQPFVVGPHLLTPGIHEAGSEAKYLALSEAKERLDAIPEEFRAHMRDALVKEAVELAGLAEFQALVFEVLCKVDPSLREKGQKAAIRDINMLDLGRVWAAVQGRELNEDAVEKAMEDHVKRQEAEAKEVLGQAPLAEAQSAASSNSVSE